MFDFSGWRRLDGPEFHAIIAAILVFAASFYMHPGIVFIINTAGWYALEAWQGRMTDKGINPFSDRWGGRKKMELLTPIAVGATVAVGFLSF